MTKDFFKELADILDAERQIVKALPQMAKAAASADLREALQRHLHETREQYKRAKKLFADGKVKPAAEACAGMKGILTEGKKVFATGKASPERDALLVAAAQKVEHYEIAAYGTLCAWARLLGLRNAFEVLSQSLEEERAADRILTDISEDAINRRASEGTTNNQKERSDMRTHEREGSRPNYERSRRGNGRERDDYGRFEGENRQPQGASRHDDQRTAGGQREPQRDDYRRSESRGEQSPSRYESHDRGRGETQHPQRDAEGRFEGRGGDYYRPRYYGESPDRQRYPSEPQRSSPERTSPERDERGRFESEGRAQRPRYEQSGRPSQYQERDEPRRFENPEPTWNEGDERDWGQSREGDRDRGRYWEYDEPAHRPSPRSNDYDEGENLPSRYEERFPSRGNGRRDREHQY